MLLVRILFFLMLLLVWFVFFCCGKRYDSAVVHAAVLLFAVGLGVETGSQNVLSPARTKALWRTFIFVCCSSTLELDRLWRGASAREASQLRSGYTGHLRNAQCSRPEDGERIRRELVESGTEEALDRAMTVLMR